LSRDLWEGIESAVRDLAVREDELYVVTGVAFQGANIKSIGTEGVLVPTSTWKAVYYPQTGGAGVYAIGQLTIENGTDRVALYGSLDFLRDKHGLT
jgi:endonuclease G, mitochondrial